jgi:regulator of protease activity HflC (stomatin/prohibitin superfamily)
MTAGAILVFAAVALPLLAFMAWILMSHWTVRIGHRQAGLVIRRGRATTKTLSAGTHFLPPFLGIVEAYPDVEMTYMTIADAGAAAEGRGDFDFVDPPFGVVDRAAAGAGVFYTVRFRIERRELKQIHERFGPGGIKGIIRDESRRIIQDAFADGSYSIADLAGNRRADLERAIHDRIKDTLAVNGFELTLFTLQEPDLRDLGEAFREQRQERELLAVEELRSKTDEARFRRLQARSQVRAAIEAERLRMRAAADAEAIAVRTRAELAANEERAVRHALAAAKAQEIEVAKQLELTALEADLRLKRAEALAQSGKVLEQGIPESLVRLESIATWREVMERWGGNLGWMPAAGPFVPGQTIPAPPPGNLGAGTKHETVHPHDSEDEPDATRHE